MVLQFWIGDDARLPGSEGAAFNGCQLPIVYTAMHVEASELLLIYWLLL
jgi:hypothetical protein